MEPFALVALSTSSLVLRYAAAFFFVLVAIAAAYALFKTGKVMDRVDVVLADVDEQAVPLLQKAGTTLDEVNGSLGNVDQITRDVANTTDRLDKMANAVEGAVSTPARKAAAFSAGVQSAVSSFMKREPRSDRPTQGEPDAGAEATSATAAAEAAAETDAPGAAAEAAETAAAASDEAARGGATSEA
jgi:hypothetical protein